MLAIFSSALAKMLSVVAIFNLQLLVKKKSSVLKLFSSVVAKISSVVAKMSYALAEKLSVVAIFIYKCWWKKIICVGVIFISGGENIICVG